jgi:hypothetical protein
LQYCSNPVKISAIVMRCPITSLVALFSLAVSVWAEENTAYNALRLVGNLRGEQTLKQVLFVSGESGNPQPGMWIIVLDDPAARGGVRELQIVSDQVASERTPVGSDLAGGKTIDLNQLNLDSDGAYQVAAEEAKKNGASFDRVNYRLTVDPETAKPTWTVRLLDTQQQEVGIVKVAADNGSLLSSSNWVSGSGGLASQGPAPSPDPEVLNQSPDSSDQPTPSQHPGYSRPQKRYAHRNHSNQDGSFSERARRYGESVQSSLERAFRKAGGWIQRKLTGQDTISLPSESDTEESDDNQDQYSRPVQPQQVPE